MAPAWFEVEREGRRQNELQEDLSKAVEMLQVSMGDGPYGIASGLSKLAERGPESLRQEFRTIMEDARFYGLGAALKAGQDRRADPNFDIFAVALIAADRQGGGLEKVLARLVQVIRDNLRVNGEIRAAQVKYLWSARVCALVPVIILTFFKINGNSYTRAFDSPAGQFLLTVGLALAAVGYIVMRWLGKIKGEHRTFR